MSKIKLDAYYDVSCQHCGKSRSADYEKGMEMSKELLSKKAYSEGWKCIGGKTLCPACARQKIIHQNKCYIDCPNLYECYGGPNGELVGWCAANNYGEVGTSEQIANGECLCISDLDINDNSIWVDVKDSDIPVLPDRSGIDSATKEKYWVIAHDGNVCCGHIYKNQYSTTGYAVYCGGDLYFNNVTRWAPNGRPKKGDHIS
jgi:hypothetical protein